MASLESTFTKNDIETLIDSMSDWEMMGNQEYHLMEMIKNAPMPPEDHEAFEMMENIKDHFRGREKDISESRVTRQEKAVFLKAKLMMVRRDLAVNQLFDFAATSSDTPTSDTPVESPKVAPTPVKSVAPVKVPVRSADAGDILALAEEYMKDIGIWDRFQNFVRERQESQKEAEEN